MSGQLPMQGNAAKRLKAANGDVVTQYGQPGMAQDPNALAFQQQQQQQLMGDPASLGMQGQAQYGMGQIMPHYQQPQQGMYGAQQGLQGVPFTQGGLPMQSQPQLGGQQQQQFTQGGAGGGVAPMYMQSQQIYDPTQVAQLGGQQLGGLQQSQQALMSTGLVPGGGVGAGAVPMAMAVDGMGNQVVGGLPMLETAGVNGGAGVVAVGEQDAVAIDTSPEGQLMYLRASVDKLTQWHTNAKAELEFLQGGASGIAGVPPTNRTLDFPRPFVLPFDPAHFTSEAVAREGLHLGPDGLARPAQVSLEGLLKRKEVLEGKIRQFQANAGRRLVTGLEPLRAKTHWDYVLQEMEWMATDFSRERMWKLGVCGTVSRAMKARESGKLNKHRRKLAREVSLLVAEFWAGLE